MIDIDKDFAAGNLEKWDLSLNPSPLQLECERLRLEVIRLQRYESEQCADLTCEVERLRVVEAAARNLVLQKGRHHTETAYRKLVEALTPNAEITGADRRPG